MAKKEEVKLNDYYIYPKEADFKISDFYKEEASTIKRELILDVTLSPKGQLKVIEKSLEMIKTKCHNLIVDFLFLKLFRLCAKDLEDFKYETALFEKYLNMFKQRIVTNIRNIDYANKKSSITADEIESLYESVEELFGYNIGLRDDFNKYKKKYFHEFKLSSHAIIRNKSIEEIEDLILKTELELSKFKSLEEANDYYIYHSGVEINEVINIILKNKKEEFKNLNYHYFIPYDAIIMFKLSDWIELFVKFNYVLSKIGCDYLNNVEFLKKYQILEIRYTIISIYSEKFR